MDYEKLLEKLKEYQAGTDYKLFLYTDYQGTRKQHKEVCHIISPQLKKEARKIIFFGDIEDDGFCRAGTEHFDER
ncbi:MAG: hypothetical protein NY202_03750 [Mollicutes bacterium UO1]